jgi:hypothetical protein
VPDLITVADEPSGATYLSLLEFARAQESLFSLVWHEQLDFDSTAADIARALKPDLVAEARTSEWPGTRLVDTFATVKVYRMSQHSTAVLVDAARLFAWVSPQRPEDLAFYTPDRRPWLGSTAHESDAFLYAENIDVPRVVAFVAGLRINRR